jgi:hypothetical protein
MISWAFPYQKQRRRVLERRPALTWVRQISVEGAAEQPCAIQNDGKVVTLELRNL